MRRRKSGSLKSGRDGKRVTSRKRPIAIGLSESAEEGRESPAQAQQRSPSQGRVALRGLEAREGGEGVGQWALTTTGSGMSTGE